MSESVVVCRIGSSRGGGTGSSTSAVAAPPFRLFGPFARPFRISCNLAPSEEGSDGGLIAGLAILWGTAGLSDRDGAFDPFAAGGPLTRILANPGLKRAASLLVSLGCLISRPGTTVPLLLTGAFPC